MTELPVQPKTYTWLKAIEDAEVSIEKHQIRIRSLRRAIKIFHEKIQTGEPFPDGEVSEHSDNV